MKVAGAGLIVATAASAGPVQSAEVNACVAAASIVGAPNVDAVLSAAIVLARDVFKPD